MNTNNKKKKLAILTYSLGSGGTEKVVTNLLWELHEKFDITLFLMNNNIFYNIPESIKIEYIDNSIGQENSFLKFLKLFTISKKFAKLSSKYEIDCSLSFMNRPNFINILSKYLGNNAKTIISERTTPSMQHNHGIQGFVNKLLIKTLYRKANIVTANSLGNTNDLIYNFGIKNVVTINNSFNFESIIKNTKENIELLNNKPIFVTVGRLDEGKNHELLIDTFVNINAYLYIIGEGVLKSYLENKIKELKIEDRVFLVGVDKNPHKYIAKSDAFIFASKFEGFPNVLIEAQICDKPIISFDCKSGPREILEDDKRIYENSHMEVFNSGILVLNNTEKSFIEAINYFLKNIKLFNNNNKLKLIEKYDGSKIANKWIENIEKITDKNILFVSYYFPPLKAIGSLRTYYFVKFLNLKGWNVSVLTTSAHKVLDTDTFLKPLENITKIDIKTFDLQMIKTIINKKKDNKKKETLISKQSKSSIINKMLFKLRNSLPLNILYEGGLMYIVIGIYQGCKILRKTGTKKIYSTFSPFSNHIIAYFIKILNKDCYWVADFRDLPFGDNETDIFFKNIQIYLNKIIIKKADKVIVISKGLENVIRKYNQNIEVITNGFDKLNNECIEFEDKKEFFDIVYTGTLYSGKRDASILFKVIKELIAEDSKYKKIRLVYAGKDFKLWNDWAKEHNLEDNILLKGVVSREEAISLQNQASVNLLLTWSSFSQNGILTGKLFEYLSTLKPIICIINGIKDKEIENMFSKINCGVVVYDDSSEILKQELIRVFNSNNFNYNFDEVDKYSYTSLVGQLEKIYYDKL